MLFIFKFDDGYPCLYGTDVLKEKHGCTSLHLFIDKSHRTSEWKKQYDEVSFDFPAQHDVDNVMVETVILVEKGENVMVPKSVPPPCGRLVKGVGKRKKGWYERGPDAKKKRVY